ncbi:hypothetical protein CYMTET_49539 [Cymbomonas tetramitiformis]|uniref:Uncharacterized protein n=1 Tax=Cymbomonas tetramitiformis TaxID=36881 RepID=A0AAE0BPY4_9CHLO|nr:hypothetical protein CYMTET_49539 [Cymbomonas tetramitiformis]
MRWVWFGETPSNASQICIRAGKDAEGNNPPQPPLALWFRGTGKRVSEAEKAAYHPDGHVYWQKCAWVDRPSSIEWQNDPTRVGHEYLANQKEKARSLGWSLLKGDRRILMTWWAGNGYKRTCGRVDFNRYFEKTGCLLDVNGEELEESVLREELAEEEELSDEDEGADEAEKWFIPTGYLAELTAPSANQLNHSLVGWHLMFKWNGVGWCHGWVNKFYPKHRRGYNFEVVYEDGDRRDHILRVQDYGKGDAAVAGAWCLLKSS